MIHDLGVELFGLGFLVDGISVFDLARCKFCLIAVMGGIGAGNSPCIIFFRKLGNIRRYSLFAERSLRPVDLAHITDFFEGDLLLFLTEGIRDIRSGEFVIGITEPVQFGIFLCYFRLHVEFFRKFDRIFGILRQYDIAEISEQSVFHVGFKRFFVEPIAVDLRNDQRTVLLFIEIQISVEAGSAFDFQVLGADLFVQNGFIQLPGFCRSDRIIFVKGSEYRGYIAGLGFLRGFDGVGKCLFIKGETEILCRTLC